MALAHSPVSGEFALPADVSPSPKQRLRGRFERAGRAGGGLEFRLLPPGPGQQPETQAIRRGPRRDALQVGDRGIDQAQRAA